MPEFNEPSHNPTDDTAEHVESVEQKLSPEVIQMIMDKVQDIDTPGIAYHSLMQKNATPDNVFQHGILGTFDQNNYYRHGDDNPSEKKLRKFSGDETGQEIADLWKKDMKEEKRGRVYEIIFFDGNGRHDSLLFTGTRKEAQEYEYPYPLCLKIVRREIIERGKRPSNNVIHFNIVGRVAKSKRRVGETQISYSYRSRITILFDITHYRENDMKSGLGLENIGAEIPRKEYIISSVGQGTRERDPDTGRIDPTLTHGFLLAPRIAPQLFRGVVVDVFNYEKGDDLLLSRVQGVVQSMRTAFKDKQELMLPIYHVNGNLLWPQQMSYEDVKKFVSERAKKDGDKQPL
ncbi:MAG: hypothetical protein Q7S16_03460 [bacterium]|nr:hypothetical protein [bacterium]